MWLKIQQILMGGVKFYRILILRSRMKTGNFNLNWRTCLLALICGITSSLSKEILDPRTKCSGLIAILIVGLVAFIAIYILKNRQNEDEELGNTAIAIFMSIAAERIVEFLF